jgi:hypothetical protein
MGAGIIYTALEARTTHFKKAAKCEFRKLFKQPSYLPGEKLSTTLATENLLD